MVFFAAGAPSTRFAAYFGARWQPREAQPPRPTTTRECHCFCAPRNLAHSLLRKYAQKGPAHSFSPIVKIERMRSTVAVAPLRNLRPALAGPEMCAWRAGLPVVPAPLPHRGPSPRVAGRPTHQRQSVVYKCKCSVVVAAAACNTCRQLSARHAVKRFVDTNNAALSTTVSHPLGAQEKTENP